MMDGQPPEPLRIGVLGAARIAALAIAGPAHTTGDRLVAVAARDRRRAEAFAASHGVERVLDTYANLVTHGRLDDRDRVESLSPLPRTRRGRHPTDWPAELPGRNPNVYAFSAGGAKQRRGAMAEFMDVHRGMVDITPEGLLEAHQADLAIQSEEDVDFKHAWADPKSGMVFCLSEGPSAEAVQRIHERAGHPADEIYEVPVQA